MIDALCVVARHATGEDVSVLVELYEAGQAQIEGERGAELDTVFRGRSGNLRDSFRADLDAEDRIVLVGTIDEVVVGYAVVSLLEPRPGHRLAEITDLFVFDSARGVGVGATLLAEVQKIADQHECTGLMARALPGDRATKNFFESLGLVARSIEVYRDLR